MLLKLSRRNKVSKKKVSKRLKPKGSLIGELSDDELLGLFQTDSRQAWDLFLDRHSNYILSVLRHMGFDHDEAMDRFVFVCEKLCEKDFRRLRGIASTGSRGDLAPWLRTVVRNLAVSWAWSVDGRRRLFKSVTELSERHQRVFELHFWQGRHPSEICEQLRVETQEELGLLNVLQLLEEVFAHLSSSQRWRLMSRLSRERQAVSIAVEDPETGWVFEPPSLGPNAEERLLAHERRDLADKALDALEPQARLILQLRYEQCLSLSEVAALTDLSVSSVKRSQRISFEQLRRQLVGAEGSASPGKEERLGN